MPAEAFANTNIGTQFHYNILERKTTKSLKFTYHEWTRPITLERNTRYLFSVCDYGKARTI